MWIQLSSTGLQKKPDEEQFFRLFSHIYILNNIGHSIEERDGLGER